MKRIRAPEERSQYGPWVLSDSWCPFLFSATSDESLLKTPRYTCTVCKTNESIFYFYCSWHKSGRSNVDGRVDCLTCSDRIRGVESNLSGHLPELFNLVQQQCDYKQKNQKCIVCVKQVTEDCFCGYVEGNVNGRILSDCIRFSREVCLMNSSVTSNCIQQAI